jgi:hypothetical protein
VHAVEANIATPDASRYLQQLCKHWSHKFAVTFSPTEGRVPFNEDATCLMNATPDVLNLRVEAPTNDEASRLADVVWKHLERFAFRAPLEAPAWRAA